MTTALLEPVDFDPFAESGPSAPVPTTDAQREIWLAVQMADDASPAYNQCFGLRISGAFDVGGMRRAVDALFARHEALRLTFDPSGENQTVATSTGGIARFIDLSGHPDPVLADARARLLEHEANEPFDLSRNPARALILRERDDLHTVVLCAHHIVCDGWSAGILLRDLGTLYEAEIHGLEARLPDAGRFSDFAKARASDGERRRAADAESYWLARFAEPASLLELPLDRARSPRRSFAAAVRSRRLGPELHGRIRAVGARAGATSYNVLLAAFQVLVFRLSGQSDLVLGIPIATQAAANQRELVGHGTNLLPLRAKVVAADPFREHLRRSRSLLLDAHEHAAVTFGALLRGLRLPRDGGRVPLVSLTFNVDRIAASPTLPGANAEVMTVPKTALNFDGEINVVDDGTDLCIEWTYDTTLFDGETIERWLEHYAEILGGVVRDPEQPISRLSLMSDAEERRMAERGAARARHTADVPVHALFEKQAAERPDAVALTWNGQSLRYGELDRRADQVAHRLIERGVCRGTLVGLAAERSLDLVVGMLGILKAGGAYLPLDPAYPADRLRFLVDDAATRIVVTQRALVASLPDSAELVVVDDAAAGLGSVGKPNARVEPSDPAYVIYTSGSTGRPKGVIVTHRNVARLFETTTPWFGFGTDDVWTLFHSFAFDFSVWEIWGALLHGGRLVVVPHAVSRDPKSFLGLLAAEHVTILNQTPSAFRALADADARDGSRHALSLRTIVFGGEALDLPSLRPWFARHGERPRLVNMYGITETTVHVTYREIREADCAAGTGSLIGVPLPDVSLHVLDAEGRLVPPGVVGEIHVGGAGVSLGYLNRRELTEDRFVPDPFSSDKGARLYRSGDLARRRADGELEYLGRADHQVKIRGFRIELGEVEAVLGLDEAVRSAVVIARSDAMGDSRLFAYVVADGDRTEVAERLRRRLRASLPDYMVPASFAILDAIPLTENGKVDRQALLDLEASRPDRAETLGPPRTEVECALAEIWSTVLGVDAVGANDNFFELGGDSLLAARMMSRAETTFGIDLPLRRLFDAPTLGALAELIEASRWAVAESSRAPRPDGDLDWEETEL